MSSTSPNSIVKSVRRNFRTRFNNILHKYPNLPTILPEEDSFPFQIGSNITVRDYNEFLDRNEKIGYKFCWDRGNVYIIEMANPEHEAAVSHLFKCFDEPNNRVKRGPIEVYGQPFHYNPIRNGSKIAPDIAVRPSNAHVSQPLIRHPGPPPSDVNGRPHARITCEVANTVGIIPWNTTCESWMHQEYVRCVLGIKIFPKIIIGQTVHRPMIARLWTRGVGGALSQNGTLARAGVYVTEWDFGTIQSNNNIPTPTGCNALNLNNFQVIIPVADAFFDPPIIGGVLLPYAVFVPPTVVGVNFAIDLFEVQQAVLDSQ